MTEQRTIDALTALINGDVGLRSVHKTITFPSAIEALEKQLIKTPNEVTTSHGKSYQCSSCGRNQRKCIDVEYCIHCGQRFKA